MPSRKDTSAFGNRARLEAFVTVAETGSLGEAERLLGIHRSSLSYAIRQLERRVGTALFERYAPGMRLTPLGTVAVHHARTVLQEMEAAEQAVARARKTLDRPK